MEQLEDRKVAIKSEIEALTVQRQELRKELRQLTRKGDSQTISEVREQIGQLSRRLKKQRSEVVLCDGIALRSGQVEENVGRLLLQETIERRAKTPQRRNRNCNIER